MRNRIRILLFCVPTALAFFTAPAARCAAGDDDGARSILADGAGNRALALGGAYAAIADDASAVIWNPGGLGRLQRREFQATHTNLIGLGFSEQYASLVLPSWRWGVGSFTFRRFGVDGIEERDERNLLLADDLSYSESELTLAYGRELGDAWSFGGGLKWRRYSLAGFDDSGVGVDLGLLVKPGRLLAPQRKWSERLTLGMALRNAVEPALRLDQESVPDPSGMRTGAAYRHPLGREGWVLGTVDLEKTREMNTHLHAGLEVRLVPALALRTGVNRGTLTAGMGVAWQDVGIDYVYEDMTDNPIHRFGASFRFGVSAEEARQREHARVEEELRKRLDDKFARRNAERRDDLLRRAGAALQLGRTAEAAELVAMIRVIDPQDTRARELEIEILRQQAADLEAAGDHSGAIVALSGLLEISPNDTAAQHLLARIRAESDRRTTRSREIRTLLDQAMDDFARGDLTAARRGFASVLELDPGDEEARAMADRTARVLGGRVGDLREQALALGDAARFDEALAKLDEAAALAPDDATLAAARRRVERMSREHKPAAAVPIAATAPVDSIAGEAAEPDRPAALGERRRREMTELYDRARAAMEGGDDEQAVRYWELVWSIDPDYQQVSVHLKQHYLARGMEEFVAGRLEAAVRHWEDAVRVAPGDEKAAGYLQRVRDQIKRLDRMAG